MIQNASNYLSRGFYVIILFIQFEEYCEHTDDKDM